MIICYYDDNDNDDYRRCDLVNSVIFVCTIVRGSDVRGAHTGPLVGPSDPIQVRYEPTERCCLIWRQTPAIIMAVFFLDILSTQDEVIAFLSAANDLLPDTDKASQVQATYFLVCSDGV